MNIESIMSLLRKEFPRRKFVHEGDKIIVQGAYTYIEIGHACVIVIMGKAVRILIKQEYRLATAMRVAFKAETTLRELQSKQRAEMKKHVAKLQQSELLRDVSITLSIEYFKDAHYTPAIEMRWTEMPDVVFASIHYNRYASGDDKYKHDFRVSFGGNIYFVNTVKEVVNLFDSNEVFKTLDTQTKPDDIKFLKRREGGQGIIRYSPSRLIRMTPYLLTVQAQQFEKIVCTTTTTANNPNDELATQLLYSTDEVECLKFSCRPELQWEYIYADQGEESV